MDSSFRANSCCQFGDLSVNESIDEQIDRLNFTIQSIVFPTDGVEGEIAEITSEFSSLNENLYGRALSLDPSAPGDDDLNETSRFIEEDQFLMRFEGMALGFERAQMMNEDFRSFKMREKVKKLDCGLSDLYELVNSTKSLINLAEAGFTWTGTLKVGLFTIEVNIKDEGYAFTSKNDISRGFGYIEKETIGMKAYASQLEKEVTRNRRDREIETNLVQANGYNDNDQLPLRTCSRENQGHLEMEIHLLNRACKEQKQVKINLDWQLAETCKIKHSLENQLGLISEKQKELSEIRAEFKGKIGDLVKKQAIYEENLEKYRKKEKQFNTRIAGIRNSLESINQIVTRDIEPCLKHETCRSKAVLFPEEVTSDIIARIKRIEAEIDSVKGLRTEPFHTQLSHLKTDISMMRSSQAIFQSLANTKAIRSLSGTSHDIHSYRNSGPSIPFVSSENNELSLFLSEIDRIKNRLIRKEKDLLIKEKRIQEYWSSTLAKTPAIEIIMKYADNLYEKETALEREYTHVENTKLELLKSTEELARKSSQLGTDKSELVREQQALSSFSCKLNSRISTFLQYFQGIQQSIKLL